MTDWFLVLAPTKKLYAFSHIYFHIYFVFFEVHNIIGKLLDTTRSAPLINPRMKIDTCIVIFALLKNFAQVSSYIYPSMWLCVI